MALPAFANRAVQPYNSLLYEAVKRVGLEVEEFDPIKLLVSPPDVWHVHWPEGYFNIPGVTAPAKAFALIAIMMLARIRGVRVVWTVHNIRSHEGKHPRLERIFWPLYTRLLDGAIYLSNTARMEAEEEHRSLRRLPYTVVPHGHYRELFAERRSVQEARRALGYTTRDAIFLYLGLIRPYKGVVQLVKTFRQLDREDVRLIVVGKPNSEGLRQQIVKESGDDSRIRLQLEFVSNEQVAVYFAAADVAVLPFKRVLNSGSALLALSLDRPVYMPRLGSLTELELSAGTDYVRYYSGRLQPEDLAEAMDWAQAIDRSEPPRLEQHEWSQIAARTVEFYRRVLADK